MIFRVLLFVTLIGKGETILKWEEILNMGNVSAFKPRTYRGGVGWRVSPLRKHL